MPWISLLAFMTIQVEWTTGCRWQQPNIFFCPFSEVGREEWAYNYIGWTRNQTQDPCNSSKELYHWTTYADIHSPYSPNYYSIYSSLTLFYICIMFMYHKLKNPQYPNEIQCIDSHQTGSVPCRNLRGMSPPSGLPLCYPQGISPTMVLFSSFYYSLKTTRIHL